MCRNWSFKNKVDIYKKEDCLVVGILTSHEVKVLVIP